MFDDSKTFKYFSNAGIVKFLQFWVNLVVVAIHIFVLQFQVAIKQSLASPFERTAMAEDELRQHHAEVEVYDFMGQTSLADLHERRGFDIGPKTLRVFRESNLFTVEAVRNIGDDIDGFEAQITAAITRLCPAGEQATDLKWRQMAARCKRVRRKLMSASAQPFEPEHLCCPISWSLFVDPVITPLGVSYSKQCIEEHLRVNPNFCPVTKQPLSLEQLIPNLSLRSVVDYYQNNYLRFSLYRQD